MKREGATSWNECIEAAGRIHAKLKWTRTDAMLANEKCVRPGFDLLSCRAKVALIDYEYGTNLQLHGAVDAMAQHICAIMKGRDPTTAGRELVGEIAKMNGRDHTSFASKFCHLFVSADRFPIYDAIAREVLERHFGKRADKYGAFCEAFDLFRSEVGSHYSVRNIDRYLWIAGLYGRWLNGKQINAEVKRLFETPDATTTRDLRALNVC